MARLNPKRRRELAQAKARKALAHELNPSTQPEIGNLKGLFDNRKLGVQLGRSSVNKGLLHQEANYPVFAQHKRRKATKKALHVNPSDVAVITTPDKVKDARLPDEVPSPKRMKRQGNKVVIVSKKVWSNL